MLTDPNLIDPRAMLMQTLGLPTEEEPVPAGGNEEEDKELGNLVKNQLKGLLAGASPTGGPVNPQEFDTRFRQNVSPAREFLANFLTGISDSMAGRKFQSVREKAFNEYVTTEQMVQQQAARQQQSQLATMQILQREMESRRENAMRLDLEAIRGQGEKRTAQQKMVEFMLKYNIDVEKLNETKTNNKAKLDFEKEQARLSQKDPLLSYGFSEARAEFEEQGLDPTKPENLSKVHDRAREIAEDLFKKREAVKGANRPASSGAGRTYRDRYIVQKVTNGWGEEEVGTINMDTGERGFAPEHWGAKGPRNFPVEERNRMNNVVGAVDSLRMAIKTIAGNPKDTTGPWQALPISLQSAFRDISPTERSPRIWFNAAVSKWILAQSGVATSGREEIRLKDGLPAFFETPSNFVPGAMSFLTMLEATLMRQQAGIDPNELDIGEYWIQYEKWVQGQLKAGKPVTKIPTGKEIIETVAKAKGKSVLYDNAGRIRGVK
jgi:hypothetical protein